MQHSNSSLASWIFSHATVISLALAVIVSVVGCSTAAETIDFPTGRFVHEAHENRILEFFEDGTWNYYEGSLKVPVVSGTYDVRGDLYTELSHDYVALPQIPASYNWEFDGSKLTFHLSGEDQLAHRKSVYDGQTYILVK